jgi:hypothetical protein
MEHPLIGNIDELTIDELSDKVNELGKKLNIAYSTGNGQLINQLQMALETFRNKYQEKLNDSYKKQNPGNIDFDSKIKIE